MYMHLLAWQAALVPCLFIRLLFVVSSPFFESGILYIAEAHPPKAIIQSAGYTYTDNNYSRAFQASSLSIYSYKQHATDTCDMSIVY